MNQTEMLHQMCHEVLAEADVRAICKHRGLPNQAASSRPMLETLFLSDAGVAVAMRALDRTEIALLHLLGSQDKPVNVAFFSRLDPPRSESWSYGTFSQRFQGVFSRVKDRLVRGGILLPALGPESETKKTKMERWQFALPVQFARHLLPLVESAKRLSGDGEWCRDVGREKLKTAVEPLTPNPSPPRGEGRKNRTPLPSGERGERIAPLSPRGRGVGGEGEERETKNDRVEIIKGELCWGGQPFRAGRVLEWRKRQWQAETNPARRPKEADAYNLPPAEAVLRILAGLDADLWSDADALAVPLEIFCGSRVDAGSVCASGWRWGFLARQEAEGRLWYRPAPPSAAADVSPDRYLTVRGEVSVDLDTVPFEALETLVLMSDQRPAPGGAVKETPPPSPLPEAERGGQTASGSPLRVGEGLGEGLCHTPGGRALLLVTPNLVKLGRTADAVAALPLADWLQKNAPAFHQAFETVRQRRGRTILHENLSVARVSDLSLKVALEKALGRRCVPLGEEFLAFPPEAVAEVKRLVAHMGHVVKEVAPGEP